MPRGERDRHSQLIASSELFPQVAYAQERRPLRRVAYLTVRGSGVSRTLQRFMWGAPWDQWNTTRPQFGTWPHEKGTSRDVGRRTSADGGTPREHATVGT
jgi:hypothetical protein